MASAPVSPSRVRQLSPGRLAELVLESAADFAIFTADLDGVITSWNSAAERVMGWSEDEAVGQHACMIFTPEDQAKAACELEMAQARAAGQAMDERWHVRKDGSSFWGSGSLTRLEDDETGEHLGYCKIVRDRTEQHEAGQRLEASKVLLRNVMESNPDCLKLLDLDGRVTFMNGPGLKLMEIDALQDISGKLWVSLWPEEERSKVESALAKASAGRTGRFQGFCPTFKGTLKWWDVQVTTIPGTGGQAGFLVSARDITELGAAQTALRESEARFRHMADSVPALIWMTDEAGQVTFANLHYDHMFGRPAAEMLGEGWASIVLPEDLERHTAAFLAAFHARTPFQTETRVLDRDGRVRWLRCEGVPRTDDAGNFLGYTGCNLDITDARLAAEELESLVAERTAELMAAEETLRQAQKLEAVGQLTGGVAHDFNNLLTVIRSSADLLRRPDLPEERRKRYVDAISDTANRAAKVTGQLLAFARRQPLKPEVFAVGERLQAVTDLIRPLVGARVSVETLVECDGYAIKADPNQFETALVNLAVNARDAMDGEGRLTVRTWLASEVPPTRGHQGTQGEFVAVSMSDTGVGIRPELMGRIFEPFFTTKEVGRGTGLGLSQVYGFAKQSGGELQVESEVGRGTTITLYLPKAEAKPAAVHTAPEAKMGSPEPGRSNVLLVEDNIEVGEFARQLLEDLGYMATWAPNAQDALAILEQRADRFDMVFSDVVMPGMNGVVLAHEIRRRWPNLRVVLTSGYSHVLANGGAQGFDLLHKPYSVEGLSKALRSGR
jgi:PAS domain S-box-containing protein